MFFLFLPTVLNLFAFFLIVENYLSYLFFIEKLFLRLKLFTEFKIYEQCFFCLKRKLKKRKKKKFGH